jgi:hypothetical protein
MQPFEEIVALAASVAAQRVRRGTVGAGRAARPRSMRPETAFQHLEALGDNQRRMVGQHTPPSRRMFLVTAAICPIIDRERDLRPMPVVMLGEPVPGIAKPDMAPNRCCCKRGVDFQPVVMTERSRTESGSWRWLMRPPGQNPCRADQARERGGDALPSRP